MKLRDLPPQLPSQLPSQLDDADIRDALTWASQQGIASRVDIMWRVQRKLAGQPSHHESSAGRRWFHTPRIVLASILLAVFAGSVLVTLHLARRDALAPGADAAPGLFPSPSASSAPQRVSAFSMDASRAAFVIQGGTIVVWDLRNSRQIQAIAPQQVVPSDKAEGLSPGALTPAWLALDATGGVLAIRMSDDIVVWDIDRSTFVSSLKLQPGNDLLALSHDGRLLAVSDVNTRVDIYDVRTGQRVASLAGQQAPLASLVFSPDSRRLVAVSLAGEVRTWEISQRGWEIAVEP